MASSNQAALDPNQKMISSADSSHKTLDSYARVMEEQAMEEKILVHENAVDVDLSSLRGIQPPPENMNQVGGGAHGDGDAKDDPDELMQEEELEALSELVPGLKAGKMGVRAVQSHYNAQQEYAGEKSPSIRSRGRDRDRDRSHDHDQRNSPDPKKIPHLDSMMVNQGLDEEYAHDDHEQEQEQESLRILNTLAEGDHDDDDEDDEESDDDHDSSSGHSQERTVNDLIQSYENSEKKRSVHAALSSSSSDSSAGETHISATDQRDVIHSASAPISQNETQNSTSGKGNMHDSKNNNGTSHVKVHNQTNNIKSNNANPNPYHNVFVDHDYEHVPGTPPRDSNNPDDSYYGKTPSPNRGDFYPQSSAQSLSTATQSHEVRMPMYLPNFRPATGCTNASDFIVRCFVARLRAGITVVKHGRSRWCKSRLRVLHVHSDGRSLSWRPAQGEPASNKRPPKLDLSSCLEVRHAWSPDPLNPMFTGTPILRSKCEASNAFKSFALIFPRRTVDITAVTADQCKVLMEGFSALCFRLQVANMAGRKQGMVRDEGREEQDGEGKQKGERMTAATTSPPTQNGTGPM